MLENNPCEDFGLDKFLTYFNLRKADSESTGDIMTTLMAIGGAMNLEEPIIFEEFIKRAGGAKAHIVVLPQASSLSKTGTEYVETFQKLGVKKPISLEFRDRVEADRKSHLDAVRKAMGIFIAGGTQMRLTALMGGTSFEQ